MKKGNNSIATKLCARLLNKCAKHFIIIIARHNSMTKLCRALFKYENKLKIG